MSPRPAHDWGTVIDELAAKFALPAKELAEAISWAAVAHDGEEVWAKTPFDELAPDALDELVAPLDHVLTLLRYEVDRNAKPASRNFHRLIETLADPKTRAEGPRLLWAEAAWPTEATEIDEELQKLVARLASLQLVAQTRHIGPRRGRPLHTRSLRAAVRHLAAFWANYHRFTSDWAPGRPGEGWQPVSEAAMFVYEAVSLIVGQEHLSQLRTVMGKVVKERNS